MSSGLLWPDRTLGCLVATSFKMVPPVTAMGQFRVRNLAGDLLLEMESESMVHLKQKVSEVCGVPEALLKVVKDNEALGNLPDLEEIAVTDEVVELMLLVDDSPCYSWDIAGNPDSEFLKSDASEIVEFVNPNTCLHPDYVNVLSQSPIEKGVHFVEFILHSLQDEQWCEAGQAAEENRLRVFITIVAEGAVARAIWMCYMKVSWRSKVKLPTVHLDWTDLSSNKVHHVIYCFISFYHNLAPTK